MNALAEGIQAETCSIVEEGSACYASADLLAILRKSGPAFSSPNDRVDIANLRRLDTQAPYGAAIMYVDTPEDPVKIIVFGDASVDAKGGNVFTMYEQGGQPICEKTPSGMLVQTPEGDTGQVVVNGVTIRLASTAFIAMDGVLLFDQDPRSGRRYGERNPEAPLCSGFDSECDFANCPVGYRLVWGPFCREDWYDYIEPGLYRVTLYGSGQVQAGATDYNATQEDFAYGVENLKLPASYTFCYPGLEPGGTGFETLVKSRTQSARVDRLTLEFLGRDCSSTDFTLSSQNQQELDRLMRRWDELRIGSLNTLDSGQLTEVLTGSALDEQLDTLGQLRDSNCNWIIDELDPAETIYTEASGPNQARVFALKNWDMDMVCRGKRLEMPDYDGNFIGAYTVQKSGGVWRIMEKEGYDIEEGERPEIAPSGDLQLMTVTNVEGYVEVTTLGVTRVILPGEQVRVVLFDNQPVDISEPLPTTVVPQSPIIDWVANDDEGLPLVNSSTPSGELSSGTSTSTATGTLAGKIVFVSSRDYEALQSEEQLRNGADLGEQSIYAMNADGSEQVKILGPVRAGFYQGDPAVNPDGHLIAQGANAGDNGITVYDLSKGTSSFMPTSERVFRVHDWSPDGRSLLVTLRRKLEQSPDSFPSNILAHFDLITGSATDLFTDVEGYIQFGSWSSDGTQIAFTNHYQLWVMNADGSDPRMVIDDARDIEWSPDGQYIAYEAGSTGDQDIWIARPDGSERRDLTNTKGVTEYGPTWSPDSRQIAFSRQSFRDGYTIEQVFVIDVSSRESRQLTDTGIRNASPYWVGAPVAREDNTAANGTADILTLLFGDKPGFTLLATDSDSTTALWSIPPRTFEYAIGTQALATVYLQEPFVQEGKEKLFVVTGALPNDEIYMCAFCGLLVDAAVLTRDKGVWRIEARTPRSVELGGFGNMPEISVVEVGPKRYALLINRRAGSWGTFWYSSQLWLPIREQLTTVLSVSTGAEDYSAECEEASTCYQWSTDISFVPHEGSNYHDIVLISNGTRPVEVGDKPEAFAERAIYVFDGSSYILESTEALDAP